MEFVKLGMIGQTDNTGDAADEQHEIKSTEPAIQLDTAPDVPDAFVGSDESGEAALNQSPVPLMPQAEEPSNDKNDDENDGDSDTEDEPAGGVRHHLTYLAHGIWKDSAGQCWHREDSKKGCISHKLMSDDELQKRPDIMFMVRYRAIKDVIVK